MRVIPTLLYRDFGLVKGERFDAGRHIGGPLQAIKVYEMRGVDELVLLDIRASIEGRGPDLPLVDDLADECFMPLAVGGGVAEVDHVGALLAVGADKVVVGTALVERPEVVAGASARFGAQCLVGSIDVRATGRATAEVWIRSGTTATGTGAVEAARRAQDLGVGEILLTSIDRDGTLSGYDLDTIAQVVDAVSVPVIASGGAGTYDDMARAVIDAGASAVAAAAMFQFTEQTPRGAKEHLHACGVPVRLPPERVT